MLIANREAKKVNLTAVRIQLLAVRTESEGRDVVVHLQCKQLGSRPLGQDVYGAESALKGHQVAAQRRRHLKLLDAALAVTLFPRHFKRLAGVQVVHEVVSEVLGAGDELLAVGGEMGGFDGEVFEVDGLHFRVQFSVDLKEGGGAVQPGHESHGGARMELGRPDHRSFAMRGLVHVLQLAVFQMTFGQHLALRSVQHVRRFLRAKIIYI